MLTTKTKIALVIGALMSASAMAKTVSIQVTNGTIGQPFATGFAIAVPDGMVARPKGQAKVNADNILFTLGKPDYGDGLKELSEQGEPDLLVKNYGNLYQDQDRITTNIRGPKGEIAPGKTSDVYGAITANTGDKISFAAMLGVTNDTFAAIQGWKVPDKDGTYTVLLHARDSGTEANNERFNGADGATGPGIPGQASTGGLIHLGGTKAEGYVYPSPGVIGSATYGQQGSLSDLDINKLRFSSVVGTITFTVRG